MDGTKWLTCKASSGQFSDEMAVRGEDYEGQEFSLFTALEFVRCKREPNVNEEVQAQLKTALLDEGEGLCLIRLPGRTFDNGSTITVRASQLEGCETERTDRNLNDSVQP